MYFSTPLLFAGLAAASPFKFPLPNGFPNPSPDALIQIQKDAQGSLPAGALPTTVTPAGINGLKLIAQNEIFEVGFFTSLLANVTAEIDGYCPSEYHPLPKEYITKTLKAIINQEAEHALGVQSAIKSAGAQPVQACQFQFPTTKFGDAIALAATFTDIALSILPAAQAAFAADGGQELGFVPLFGSVIAQEGEQDGFFRALGLKTPSAAPFLTVGSLDFAFNAIQGFIVPGSCPDDLTKLGFKQLKDLSLVEKNLQPVDQTITFTTSAPVDKSKNSVVYITGLQNPLTVQIDSITTDKGVSTIKVSLPFASKIFSNGLTFAALVDGTGSLSDVKTVVSKAVAGPGLVEVQ